MRMENVRYRREWDQTDCFWRKRNEFYPEEAANEDKEREDMRKARVAMNNIRDVLEGGGPTAEWLIRKLRLTLQRG
ncbi:hypothetical protein [Desulfoscipio gibsoniae]